MSLRVCLTVNYFVQSYESVFISRIVKVDHKDSKVKFKKVFKGWIRHLIGIYSSFSDALLPYYDKRIISSITVETSFDYKKKSF